MPVLDGGERTFIGRRAERAALTRVWDGLRSGAGAVLLDHGEAGMGKTRLAEELLAVARPAHAGRATALDLGGGAPPFGLWAELLAGLARRLDPPPADGEWPDGLARLAPASAPRRLGRTLKPPANVPAELARARLFEAAVELAEHATRTRPLVLLLDDVHLADAPKLALDGGIWRGASRSFRCCCCSLAGRIRGATQSTRSCGQPRRPAPRRARLDLEPLVGDKTSRKWSGPRRWRDRGRRREPAARARERRRDRAPAGLTAGDGARRRRRLDARALLVGGARSGRGAQSRPLRAGRLARARER